MEINTNLIVVLKDGSRLKSQANGEFELDEYIKKHNVTFGSCKFIRIYKISSDVCDSSEEKYVAIDQIASIAVSYEEEDGKW
jgi:hypothetical protein